jgi:CubicO group peptidase (beta-lactamase class C family)
MEHHWYGPKARHDLPLNIVSVRKRCRRTFMLGFLALSTLAALSCRVSQGGVAGEPATASLDGAGSERHAEEEMPEPVVVDPVPEEVRAPNFADVEARIEAGTREAFPAAVLLVMRNGAIVHRRAYGVLDPEASPVEPLSLRARFDLASLTKLFTATAFLRLVHLDEIQIDRPVQQVVPEFSGPGKEQVTFRHLLTHSSGLPAYGAFYGHGEGPDDVIAAICRAHLQYAPGTRVVYSCLGYILMGHAMARITGLPLDRWMQGAVLDPLGISEAGYNPTAVGVTLAVPTGNGDYRRRRLRGEVHDPLASAMAGVSGNAGLFGTAESVARLGQVYLDGGVAGDRVFLSETLVREATREHIRFGGERRGLGWALKPQAGGSAGRLMSPSSYGHTGFTGTSIWIDPVRRLLVVFLTNRVWFGDQTEILPWRQLVHDGIVRALDA